MAALITATALLGAGAAAQQIQTEFYPNQTQLEPGNQTTVGNLEVTADNTSLSNIEIEPQFPFTVSSNPGSRAGLNTDQSFNSTIQANPNSSTPPGNYTRAIRVQSDSSSVSPRFSLSIPRVSTYDVVTSEVNKTISVGSSGNFGAIPVNGTGNTDIQVDVNATGNLTEHIDIRETASVFPQVQTQVPVNYAVDRNTPFGFYNATVNISGGGEQTDVRLSSQFRDEIEPEIGDVRVPDVQATQNAGFVVEASDNLQVANITAEVLREIETQQNNETVINNQTFNSAARFTRSSENSNDFNYTFSDSDQEGQYHLNLTVEDGAGNQVSELDSFKVERLNGTQTTAQNFEFEATQPGNQVEKQVFRNLIDTPVNITLSRLSHESSESTFEIGIRKPGEDVAEKFDGEGSTIQVRSEGSYSLVVESNEVEEFDGRLKLGVVPQAREPEDVVFGGEFLDPEFPLPSDFSIGRFEGEVGYGDDSQAEKDRIVMELEGSAEQCRGFDSFQECINGFSLGEIPDVKDSVNQAQRERNLALVGMILSFVFLGGYLLKERQTGLHTLVERVEIE